MHINEDGSVNYAVYGTLKKGFHNHFLLNQPGVDFLGEHKTDPRFTMYSLGGFPGVTEEGNTSLQIEIYNVKNKDVIRNVNSLEGYYGPNNPKNWYDVTVIDTPYGKANMFIMNSLFESDRPKVKSGNWGK